MKVYITKYALTSGIREVEADLCNPTMVKVKDEAFGYYHDSEWFKTREAALKRANAMRMDKIRSLKKQIDKLSVPIV